MKISPLIEHLRTTMPFFANKIAGCVDFKQVLEDEPRLQPPALYIQLSPETGEPVFPQMLTYYQLTSQSIYAFLWLDNTSDPRGQTAQDKVDDFRTLLNSSLVNYIYIPQKYPIEFVRSTAYFMDRARYIHLFEYKIIQLLDASDGYLPDHPKLQSIISDWDLQNANPVTFPNTETQNTNLFP